MFIYACDYYQTLVMALSHAISAAAVKQTHTVNQWGKREVKITAEIKDAVKSAPVPCRMGDRLVNHWAAGSFFLNKSVSKMIGTSYSRLRSRPRRSPQERFLGRF